MNALLVVNHRRDWTAETPGVDVVSAREYLTDPAFGESRPARVLNLCRTDRYQGRGYYVSLVAEARGHRPLPDVKTIGDVQAKLLTDLLGAPYNELAQRALANQPGDRFVVDAYFGRDPTGRFDALAQQLFAVVRAPLLRASFERADAQWRVSAVRIVGATEIDPRHRSFVTTAVADYVTRNRPRARNGQASASLSLAILHNEDEPEPPSNRGALENFFTAARKLGMHAEFLRRGDIERVPQFDGLFIRDTTGVGHYTYQFARRAASEGLIVIDDPDSILKCNNKVYLNELLARHRVPIPKTLLVSRDNIDQIVPQLGLPCILKQPDSAFSLGVSKIHSPEELRACVEKLLAKSHLVIAQEWVPTEFDWRVGILDRRVLYVCKYFMAAGHWQVIKREADRKLEGSTVAMTVGEAPEIVVKTALRAANLIGDGFYGVDLKEANDQCYVIEINDNPNIDAGNEDSVLKDALYREIVGVLARRMQERPRTASQ